jgi:hypothetical protein
MTNWKKINTLNIIKIYPLNIFKKSQQSYSIKKQKLNMNGINLQRENEKNLNLK